MVGEIMAKKNGVNAVANTALIAGGILILAGVLAFLFFNGDTRLQQFIVENRSEVIGVGVGIFVVGLVAKLRGVKIG